MVDEVLYDVTILGGGPIGLFSAFYSGMRDLKTKVIEWQPELGGKVSMFFPEKTIRDIGGITGILGSDLIQQLEQQARTFDPTIICGQLISDMQRLADGTFRLTSTTGDVHHTRTIILTVGHGTFKPIELDLEGAQQYASSNLQYAVEEISAFQGKQVLISGGGNSAVDWANELLPVAKNVTVVHRRDEFAGHERNVATMMESARVLTPYALQKLHGDGHRIEQVTIGNLETGETETIEIDELIVNHGIRGDYGGINQWGLEMHEERIVVNGDMETNIPGIFAAGDAVTHPFKLKLMAGGFTEGPLAVNGAQKYLRPEEQVQALYSTHHDKLIETSEQEA